VVGAAGGGGEKPRWLLSCGGVGIDCRTERERCAWRIRVSVWLR
jgi:hypothetical protein